MFGISVRKNLHRVIREYEVSLAIQYMPRGGRLLEIGAGDGNQAKYLQAIGFEVDAVDVKDSIHIENAVFPVKIYDGQRIPYSDNTFDVIFTSNVLEHIPWCEDLLSEMKRVLKDNGIMIHIVPTPYWRLWTSFAHYVHNFKILIMLLQKITNPEDTERNVIIAGKLNQKRSLFRLLRIMLLPFRHGVRGNWFTEVYYFSYKRWVRSFQIAGLKIINTINTNIFYTGYGIPGSQVSLETRYRLARLLGSSTTIYVLQKG